MDQIAEIPCRLPGIDDDYSLCNGELEMKRNWSWFAGASIFAGYFLIAAGAPPLAVGLGIGFGALLTHHAARAA
jgi:hypothetical protein